MKLAAFLLLLAVMASGCTTVGQVTDCVPRFEECKYACGEGVFAGTCKEKCTWEYDQCKSEKEASANEQR
ncbi:MAG: hypothetical protein HYY37_05615 [Candidatus Aenigmarchaeota archaeon]|nr:hypothetical protein [Candidatus Aenigmarchaeota archaeon]